MPRVGKLLPAFVSHAWLGYGVAAGGVIGMTAVIHLVPGAVRIANVSMLYLLVVIGTALGYGSGPAVLAAFLAFLAFDFFFVNPTLTFTVHDPAEWIALLMFLVTAGVTGQMTALLRDRAEEARRRERETAALAAASWAVAAQVDRDHALAEVLRHVAGVIPVGAVGIILPGPAGALEVAAWDGGSENPPEAFPDATRGAIRSALEQGRAIGWNEGPRQGEKALSPARPAAAYLPLTAENRVLGVLLLQLRTHSPVSPQERRVVQSLANQAAVVVERDRLARLELRAQALAEADRLKTALLSMVSHDFRSPLTGIIASVSSLLQDGQPLAPATQRELLEGVEHEAERLNHIVGNILALSRLEADAWRPQCEEITPGELVGAALSSFSREAGQRVVVEIAPDLETLEVDPVQIVQVLHNLVENALKYSPAGSPVALASRREGGGLVFEVLDRGPGLPPGEETQVFQPFYRAPQYRESVKPGLGIGLAICRGLAQAHRGELSAGNREGGGAVFRLRLPLGPVGKTEAGERP
jgi:two-component system sensor histidine kinase KdpD